MTLPPFARFGLLLIFSPLVPWVVMWLVPSSVAGSGNWIGGTFGFHARAWMTMIGISAPVLIALAACLGLLRVGPILIVAILVAAVCVPAAFMLLGFWSMISPVGALLGALPAFAIATLDKSDRMAGYDES
jgi:hypothetical protein